MRAKYLLLPVLLTTLLLAPSCRPEQAEPRLPEAPPKSAPVPRFPVFEGSWSRPGVFEKDSSHVAVGILRYASDTGWSVRKEGYPGWLPLVMRGDMPRTRGKILTRLEMRSDIASAAASLLGDYVVAEGKLVTSKGVVTMRVTTLGRVTERVRARGVETTVDEMLRPGFHRIYDGRTAAVGWIRDQGGRRVLTAEESSASAPFVAIEATPGVDAAFRRRYRRITDADGRVSGGAVVVLGKLEQKKALPVVRAEDFRTANRYPPGMWESFEVDELYLLPPVWWDVEKPGVKELPRGVTRVVGVVAAKPTGSIQGQPIIQPTVEPRMPFVSYSEQLVRLTLRVPVSSILALDGRYAALEGAFERSKVNAVPPTLVVRRVIPIETPSVPADPFFGAPER